MITLPLVDQNLRTESPKPRSELAHASRLNGGPEGNPPSDFSPHGEAALREGFPPQATALA